MITPRLKIIFGLSIPLFIVHGTEEFMTGFYNLNQWHEWIFGLLPFTSVHQATFSIFQVMFWVLLIVSFLLLFSERTRFYVLVLIGIIYIFELHHIVKAALVGGYYPGFLTALFFPIAAFFFWREWLRIFWRTTPK